VTHYPFLKFIQCSVAVTLKRAVNSQKEAGKVDPETGKITRPTTTVESVENDSNEYEGRGFKLDLKQKRKKELRTI